MRDLDTRVKNCFKIVCSSLALCVAAFSSRAEILEHWSTNLVSSIAGMDCVVYANGRYVAFGEYSDYGVIFSSEDGKTWTLRSDGLNSDISYSIGLVFTGTRFFALGGFGTSGTSTNGISWGVFSFPNYGNANGVAFAAGLYVAVSDGFTDFGLGSCIARSTDGTNWMAATNSAPLGDIAFGAGRFVAIGAYSSSGSVYRSSNGTNWTQSSIPGGSQISFQNGLFIVPYGPGTNLISTTGLSWAPVETGITNLMGKVLSSHGILLARAGVYLVTSTNGTNWVQYANRMPGNSFRQPNLATDGTRIVTVGYTFTTPPYYHGFIYTSDELVGIRLTGGLPPTLAISGLVGRQYGVDSADEMPLTGNPLWHSVTTFPLLSNPTVIVDNTATNSRQRFYRGVLLP
jgi:hypothetical protein